MVARSSATSQDGTDAIRIAPSSKILQEPSARAGARSQRGFAPTGARMRKPTRSCPSGGATICSPTAIAPSGRGKKLTASPVAERAEAAGIEVLKPKRAKDEDFVARLTELAPDYFTKPVSEVDPEVANAARDLFMNERHGASSFLRGAERAAIW